MSLQLAAVHLGKGTLFIYIFFFLAVNVCRKLHFLLKMTFH